ncbi:MAG: hypothetical protein ACFFBP_08025 [Promethearchaeota archaeon]
MSKDKKIEDLFIEWNDLNNKVASSFGDFDFDTIKEIRKKQRIIEDSIYSIVLSNADDDLISILPEDCGEMEVGYESEEKKFYFLMFDPEQDIDDEDAPVKITAIVINSKKEIEVINDFKTEE